MKTKLVRRIVAAVGIACCSLCLLATPAATLPVQAATGETTISPQSVEKGWILKEENGKLYKRLWNYTYGCWEGDWIYVRDL